VLGLEASKGALAPGFDADLVVLDDSLEVVDTMVAGRWIGE
jgi:N-acetylglucosamine-6-phosphate deacetylase